MSFSTFFQFFKTGGQYIFTLLAFIFFIAIEVSQLLLCAHELAIIVFNNSFMCISNVKKHNNILGRYLILFLGLLCNEGA